MTTKPRKELRKMSAKQEARRLASGENVLWRTVRPPQGAGASVPKVKSVKSKPAKPRTKVKPVNGARRKKEFARCYGSSERVEFVKALPCILCEALFEAFDVEEALARFGPSENAHTVTGGKGRKADFATIVPLCHAHHERYDRYIVPFDLPEMRDAVKVMAPVVEAAWQSHLSNQQRNAS